jgi:hypothetical protein
MFSMHFLHWNTALLKLVGKDVFTRKSQVHIMFGVCLNSDLQTHFWDFYDHPDKHEK